MPTFSETIKLLDEFTELPAGWNYGEGSSISKPKVELGKSWLAFFRQAGFSRFNAFPGVDDEIRLRIYHQELMLDLFFETEKSVDITVRKGKEVLSYDESATPVRQKEIINSFINDLCLMSAPFTIDTSTSKQTSLPLNSLSKEKIKEYLSSITNARLRQAAIYAAISAVSTRMSPHRRHRSTISFQKGQSPPSAASLKVIHTAETNATTTFSIGTKNTKAKPLPQLT